MRHDNMRLSVTLALELVRKWCIESHGDGSLARYACSYQ